jgi:hypothetical protein
VDGRQANPVTRARNCGNGVHGVCREKTPPLFPHRYPQENTQACFARLWKKGAAPASWCGLFPYPERTVATPQATPESCRGRPRRVAAARHRTPLSFACVFEHGGRDRPHRRGDRPASKRCAWGNQRARTRRAGGRPLVDGQRARPRTRQAQPGIHNVGRRRARMLGTPPARRLWTQPALWRWLWKTEPGLWISPP